MIRHASGLSFVALLLASAPALAQNGSTTAPPPKASTPSTPAPTPSPSPPPASEAPPAETPVVTTPPVVVVPAPAPAPAPPPVELQADVPYPNGFADPTAPYNDMAVTVHESESFWDWGLLGLLGLFGLLGLRGPRGGGYRQFVRDERYEEDRYRRDGSR